MTGTSGSVSESVSESKDTIMSFGHEKLDVYRTAIERYFEIARGSALECGAAQDVLQVCGALAPEDNITAKVLLDRIIAMLTKLGQRGYIVNR